MITKVFLIALLALQYVHLSFQAPNWFADSFEDTRIDTNTNTDAFAVSDPFTDADSASNSDVDSYESYDRPGLGYFQTVALHHKKKKAPAKAHTPAHGKVHAVPHDKHHDKHHHLRAHAPVHRLRHRSKPSRRIIPNPDDDFGEPKGVDPNDINEGIDESESAETAKTPKKILTTSEEFDRVRLSEKLVPSRGPTSKKKKNKKSNGSINIDKCLKEKSKGDKLDYKTYLSCAGCCDKGTVREKNGILDPRDLPKGYKPGDTITRRGELLTDQPEYATEAPPKDGYFSRMGRFFKNLFTWSKNDDDGGQKDITGLEDEEEDDE